MGAACTGPAVTARPPARGAHRPARRPPDPQERLSRPGREDWAEASVRIDSVGSAVLDILALGAEVEVLRPAELRARVGETARKLAELHRDGGPGRPALRALS